MGVFTHKLYRESERNKNTGARLCKNLGDYYNLEISRKNYNVFNNEKTRTALNRLAGIINSLFNETKDNLFVDDEEPRETIVKLFEK